MYKWGKIVELCKLLDSLLAPTLTVWQAVMFTSDNPNLQRQTILHTRTSARCLFKPSDTTYEYQSHVLSTKSNSSFWKKMFPAKMTVKLAVLLALAIVHADGYYSCCGGLCYKQCDNTNCLCTNNVPCTTNDDCASMGTCSTPCSLSAINCPETPLKCFGRYCWQQCENGENSWCTNYADVECVRDSQCSSLNCTYSCIPLNPYDCISPFSYAGISSWWNKGFCYR